MIPKKIHYVWIGDASLPEPDRAFVEGWRKLHPDWEIRCWGLDDLKGVDNVFIRETLAAKSWVFVSDWLRLHALANEGGFYLDTDVELKGSLEPFRKNDLCLGLNKNGYPQTAVLGAVPHQPLIEELLAEYSARKFVLADGVYDETASNSVYFRMFARHGVKLDKLSQAADIEVLPGVRIYPAAILCRPGEDPSINVATHHLKGAWLVPYKRKSVLNLPFGFRVVRMKRRKVGLKDAPLNLLPTERLVASIHFGRVYLVFVRKAK